MGFALGSRTRIELVCPGVSLWLRAGIGAVCVFGQVSVEAGKSAIVGARCGGG